MSDKPDEAEAERRKQIVSRLVIRETERNIAAQFEQRYGKLKKRPVPRKAEEEG